jgi:hypothetical protein
MRRIVGAVLVPWVMASRYPAGTVLPGRAPCGVRAVYQSVAVPYGTLVTTMLGGVEEVTAVYSPMQLQGGTYTVAVTRKSQDFYQVDQREIFIRTAYCYEYAYGESAVLEYKVSGEDRLVFGEP